MVLKIIVKTLDSRNYQFEADNDWTVSRFKEHIQDTVNVPSNEQRLIFCGRVLQNDKKLTEYDCDGKVIHLVRRPPPSLDNPDRDSATNESDTNNNDSNFPREFRFGDDNNVLFSAMTLGPDGNLNQILRHIMTLQQALYSRTFGEPSLINGPTDLEHDMDRRLNNAARLLRITVNLITECTVRLPSSSPLANRSRNRATGPTASSSPGQTSGLEPPRSVLTAASSHSDLRADDDMQTSDAGQAEANASSAVPASTTDDSNIGSPRANPPLSRLPRQSLTTDNLPHNDSRPSRPFAPVNVLRSRNESRNGPLTGAQRDEFYLDRYMTILNCSSDVQSQSRALIRRYRELINMSRCGGLIVPAPAAADSHQSTNGGEANSDSTSRSTSTDRSTPTAPEAQPRQPQISSSLMHEARILSQYVPRIMHHSSHLQHSLSDFSVDFARGRLQVVSSHQQPQHPLESAQSRPRYTARRLGTGTRSPQQPRSSQSDRPGEQIRIDPAMEGGSITITATTVESPLTPTLSTTTMHPQASATIVVTSEPGQSGFHIPVSIPLAINTRDSIQLEFPIMTNQRTSSQGQNATRQESTQSQGQSEQQSRTANQDQQQQSRSDRETASTQTAPRPYGIISGRIPLPFDYYLTCFSPFAQYSAPARSSSRTTDTAPVPRVQVRTSRQQESTPSTSERPTSQNPHVQSEGISVNSQPLDAGLTEVVSNILGSIFRPATSQSSSPPTSQRATNTPDPSQDPLLNMIPELAINAASQILGGVFGIPSDMNNQRAQQQDGAQHNQQHSQQMPSTIQVMMDIDIDDSSSSHSESRYQDARDSVSAAQAQTVTSRPSSSSYPSRAQEQSQTNGRANASGSASREAYTRDQIIDVLQSHPDWIPIIEADINLMEQQSTSIGNSPPYFSDAYLSSVPRKRRRLLTATPDRVLILHPSPSQAITNLLRRAIVSSSLPIDPQDQLLTSIANDQELQDAYEDYIKSAVEARLKTDYDYCPEKFENSSKYFK